MTHIRHCSRISTSRSKDYKTLDSLQVRLARSKQASDTLGKDMLKLPKIEGPDACQSTTENIRTSPKKVRPCPHRPRWPTPRVARLQISGYRLIHTLAGGHPNQRHRSSDSSQSLCDQLGSTFRHTQPHDFGSRDAIRIRTLVSYVQPAGH